MAMVTTAKKKTTSGGGVPDAAIYLRASRGGRSHVWFLLGEEETQPYTSPVFSEDGPLYRNCSGVGAVGSTIYSVGGEDPTDPYMLPRFVRDVYCIDTLRPEDGWRKLESCIHPRARSQCVTIDGELYVMGACINASGFGCPRPEVFNPSFDGGGWRELRDSPEELNVPGWMDGHAVLDGGDSKRVILHSHQACEVYSYDLGADSWEVFQHIGPYSARSAFVDGVLYYLDNPHPGVMFALDLSSPQKRPKKVVLGIKRETKNRCWIPQFVPEFQRAPTTFLVSLGNGKLAALWTRSSVAQFTPDCHILVVCSKIKMCKEEGSDGKVNFVAYPVSYTYHFLQADRISDCLAVSPPQTSDTQNDSKKKKNRKKKKKNKNKKKNGNQQQVN